MHRALHGRRKRSDLARLFLEDVNLETKVPPDACDSEEAAACTLLGLGRSYTEDDAVHIAPYDLRGISAILPFRKAAGGCQRTSWTS